MRRWTIALAMVAVAMVWLPAKARAAVLSIMVRGAEHPGYTRLVFELPGPVTSTVQHDGMAATIAFNGLAAITPSAGLNRLRYLDALRLQPGSATLSLAPGVTLTSFVLGERRIVDLHAPRHADMSAIAARVFDPTPAPPIAAVLVPDPVTVTVPAAEPAALPAVLVFPPGTGAAAFWRGDRAMAVFDARPSSVPPALPGFVSTEVQLLPQATVLRLRLPKGYALALDRHGVEWWLCPVPSTEGAETTITPLASDGHVDLPTRSGGHVVVVADPITDDTLLVGTLLDAGPHVASGRRFAEFSILPTLLGVAIDPLSDRVALAHAEHGYVVQSSVIGSSLSVTPAPAGPVAPVAPRFTRSFDLPDDSASALLRRYQAQLVESAGAPVGTRLPDRQAVAQTMLALGLGPEAQGVLQVAATDDPRALSDPAIQALYAAAALIAGRLDLTSALATVVPDETDEHRLWRALRSAAMVPDGTTPDPTTTHDIAAGADLLLSYPPTLQRILLPLAAETLVRGGALADADRLCTAAPDDRRLDFARAAALQAHGQIDAALAAYDRLTGQNDRSLRADAAVAALRLRLATGRITPAEAARAGDRLRYAWRGDARERNFRLRVADWHGRAGQYRQQLEGLRDTLTLFPNPAEGVQARLDAAFVDITGKLIAPGANPLAPLELVSLIEENQDLLPDGAAGEALASAFADRLAALDLPGQAAKVLEGLIHGTHAPATRAAFGARLATIDLADGNAQAAIDALMQSAPADPAKTVLTTALADQRGLLLGRAQAALGNRPAALSSLAAVDTTAALLERARIEEDASDWPAAAATLADTAARTLPPAGPLDSAESGLVLRWASALAQVGDEAGLARLRTRYTARLPDRNDADLLGVLTEPPVQDVADLPRAAQETAAARTLPAALQATRHPD